MCSISDCNKPVQARGWCQKHYAKWRIYGDPLHWPTRYYSAAEDELIILMRERGAMSPEIAQALPHRSSVSVQAHIGKMLREGRAPKRCSIERAHRNLVLDGYRRDARRHEREWSLSDQDFDDLVASDCFYCGLPPSNQRKSFTYSGIDRANNNLGYIPGNVIPCCETCNYAKRAMSQDEFFNWIERVYLHAH